MSSVILFRFRSSSAWEEYRFDGPCTTLAAFKQAIIEQKALGKLHNRGATRDHASDNQYKHERRVMDFDLVFFDEGTKRPFQAQSEGDDDVSHNNVNNTTTNTNKHKPKRAQNGDHQVLIPKNSRVIICRVAKPPAKVLRNNQRLRGDGNGNGNGNGDGNDDGNGHGSESNGDASHNKFFFQRSSPSSFHNHHHNHHHNHQHNHHPPHNYNNPPTNQPANYTYRFQPYSTSSPRVSSPSQPKKFVPSLSLPPISTTPRNEQKNSSFESIHDVKLFALNGSTNNSNNSTNANATNATNATPSLQKASQELCQKCHFFPQFHVRTPCCGQLYCQDCVKPATINLLRQGIRGRIANKQVDDDMLMCPNPHCHTHTSTASSLSIPSIPHSTPAASVVANSIEFNVGSSHLPSLLPLSMPVV